MKSYSERKIFPPLHLLLYRRAAELVAELDLTRLVLGEELRCHELARAVHMRLCVENYPLEFSDRFEVVDGRSGIVEHSWLELETKGFRSIIDPYAVGRLPQVQLLDVHHPPPCNLMLYCKGEPRTDICDDHVLSLLTQFEINAGPSIGQLVWCTPNGSRWAFLGKIKSKEPPDRYTVKLDHGPLLVVSRDQIDTRGRQEAL